MEISLFKVLLSRMSSYLHLSSSDNINCHPVMKYYQYAEEILKLLKPILDEVVDSENDIDEVLKKEFEELSHSVDELGELFQNWHPLSSKVFFVLQSESLISNIRHASLDIIQLLQCSPEYLPAEHSSTSLEQCVQKIKYIGREQTSPFIKDALRDQLEGVGPSSEVLVKIAEILSLRSNKEILIEAVSLEKLKENAEQAERTGEDEYIDQLIALITRMHEHLIVIKQSQSSSPVPIPPDFCCPLSLELMTDPVIVASGQTYERVFIKEWIDLGLTVCPKTRQTLAHTNLIPNYTVKALVANWCELNNVKLPDPIKSVSLNPPSPLLGSREFGAHRESSVFTYIHNSYQSMSSESSKSEDPPAGKNFKSSGGGSLPLHPRSPSEESLPSGNGSGLDLERISMINSEDGSGNLEKGSLDSVGEPSMSPLPDLQNAIGSEQPQGHNRTVSASNAVHDFPPRELSGDASDTSQVSSTMTGYISDASGEMKSDPQPAAVASTTTPLRGEPEFPPRLMDTARSRSHSMWRRPSDRFVSRIVSSSAIETRPDLTGVEAQVQKLVEDLKSPSLETLRAATAELRLLARHNVDNRIVIANCGAITLLVDLLRSEDTETQEHAVTALLNLSINDNNKTAIAQANAIEPLIHVLQAGSPEAKENSAATLFSLSVIEENKVKIGRTGAIGPLVDLLGNGTPRGKKDAATALFNLSLFHENKARIVQAGAVKHLVELMDPAAGMVDKAVAVLANLATIPEGRSAIGQEGGIPVLVEVVELGSARGKENAAAALLQLCTTSSRFCSLVLQEGAVPPLVALSQSGTPRAKEKAQGLLSYFRSHRHGNAGRG